MSLKSLEQMGAFVSDTPVKKEITFNLDTDEKLTATIYVRKLCVGEYERMLSDNDNKNGWSARVISESVLLGEGKERIPVDKAFRLHKNVAKAMLDAFNEVNAGKKG